MLLHRYAQFLAACTLMLVVVGSLVTSTGSGLSVPDWPNSYGYFMFSFPLSGMVGGIFYEHGHRLLASCVGMLTIGLMVWLWIAEPRRWMRRLGVVALAAVIAQGTLGGLTVLYFLPTPISVAHAGLAQIFLCITMSIALFTSRGWIDAYREPDRAASGSGAGTMDAPALDARLVRLTTIATALVYVQILLGATMRHTGAGLAIPDVPLAFGHLLPPVWTSAIAIHFAHRVGALVAAGAIAMVATRVWSHHRGAPHLARPALLLAVLVVVQITLGLLTVATAKDLLVNTVHILTGSLVLVTSLVLAWRARRRQFAVGLERTDRSTATVAVQPASSFSNLSSLSAGRRQ